MFFKNAERVVKTGMALKLKIADLEKEEFKETILTLLNDKKFKEKAQLMSRNYRDQPQTPMERAMWWVDYVVRNPDVSFLKNPKLMEMNYLVKHSVDVCAFVTAIIVVVLLLSVKLCVILFRRRGSKKVKTQ